MPQEGNWTHNWGKNDDFDGKTDGTVYNAKYNSTSNILFNVAEDNSTFTLRLDLSEFVSSTKAGAKFSVLVTPPLTSYDLWVGGVQVTSENASNVLGDGTVSYDNSKKTLILDGADISNDMPIASSAQQFKYIPGIALSGYDLTVKGNGKLKTEATMNTTSVSAYGIRFLDTAAHTFNIEDTVNVDIVANEHYSSLTAVGISAESAENKLQLTVGENASLDILACCGLNNVEAVCNGKMEIKQISSSTD